MTVWSPTTEKPYKRKRRKMSLVVLNPGAELVSYDVKTGLVRNSKIEVSLTDYEWWIFAPQMKLRIA